MGDASVRRVVVVIPARDEEDRVGEAVSAVRASAALLPTGVRAEVVVVANGCSDRTADVAMVAGAHVLVAPTPNVGAARAAGGEWALRLPDDPRRLWIASTDADSLVPAGWLAAQVDRADAGADVVLGTVTLPPDDLLRHAAWARRYVERPDGAEHGHVHGANLGVRGSAYASVGGFRGLALHEDADLVTRLLAAGVVAAWAGDIAVTTSARHQSRVVGGVGTDLAESLPPSIVA